MCLTGEAYHDQYDIKLLVNLVHSRGPEEMPSQGNDDFLGSKPKNSKTQVPAGSI